MSLETKIDITPELAKTIETALQKELEKEFDAAIQNFNDKKLEILARILLNIKHTIDIRTEGKTVTFIIHEITKE